MAKQSAESAATSADNQAAGKRAAAARDKAARLRKIVCSWQYEEAAQRTGASRIAGIDEVGRGCLFGPVVAAAVILPLGCELPGLRDSKQLRPRDRERLSEMIQKCCLASAVAEVDSVTIDRVNIYQATRLAMLAAIQKLDPPPDFLLIDAMKVEHNCPQQSLIYGDALSLSIAAASVLAKVYRDALMCRMDAEFPGYEIAAHKGYGTAKHLEAIHRLGPTAQHRKSFAPMRQMQFFD
jgi:ribonuclease HII